MKMNRLYDCALCITCLLVPLFSHAQGSERTLATSKENANVVKNKAPAYYGDLSQKMWNQPPLHESRIEKDQNHRHERWTCHQLFESGVCYSVDGVYIGYTDIGINRYEMSVANSNGYGESLTLPFAVRDIGPMHDSILVDRDPKCRHDSCFWIYGHPIMRYVDYHSKKGILRLVSLEEIRKEKFPKLKGECRYMVNKFFVTDKPELLKFDRDFLYKVEALDSEVVFPGTRPHFTLIRVFTWTHHNWHPAPIGGEYNGDIPSRQSYY